MDIEKLIERLRRYSEPVISYKLDSDFAASVEESATALSTLQAENEKLRDELEKVKQKYDEAREAICTHCMDVPCRGESCYWWRSQKGD